MNVRRQMEVLGGPHLAGAAHAGLHLVADQQDAVLFRDAHQFIEELLRRDDIAAFALHRFDDDGGHFIGGRDGLQQRVFDKLRALHRAVGGRLAERAAIAVGIRRVHHAGHQRSEAAALHGLARGERQRAHGAAVEGAQEGDEPVAAGGIARQLHGAFDGFRARIAERNAPLHAARRQRAELLRQIHQGLVIEIGPRHVDQAAGLLADGFHHARMAVAGGHHGDAGVEIQETVAVHVFDDGAFAAAGYQRIAARVGWRKNGGRARSLPARGVRATARRDAADPAGSPLFPDRRSWSYANLLTTEFLGPTGAGRGIARTNRNRTEQDGK
jgi:hypothetical protein